MRKRNKDENGERLKKKKNRMQKGIKMRMDRLKKKEIICEEIMKAEWN
jgi:hypothetical protein